MKAQTFGALVASLRKERGLTQLELAEKMGVTDKAVSKWERGLSFPDVGSIPKLAEVLHVTVDSLMGAPSGTETGAGGKVRQIIQLALKGVALAMGIAVVVLSVMDAIDSTAATSMLGTGLACLALAQLSGGE